MLNVFGPLGRGFEIKKEVPACLVGGGLGIAPLLFLAKRICRIKNDIMSNDTIILGGRSAEDVETAGKGFWTVRYEGFLHN